MRRDAEGEGLKNQRRSTRVENPLKGQGWQLNGVWKRKKGGQYNAIHSKRGTKVRKGDRKTRATDYGENGLDPRVQRKKLTPKVGKKYPR